MPSHQLISDIQAFIDAHFTPNQGDPGYLSADSDYSGHRGYTEDSEDIVELFSVQENFVRVNQELPAGSEDNQDHQDKLRKQSIFLKEHTLEEIVKQRKETFSEMLFRLIAEKELREVDVYKGAQLDRKLFSKIRSDRLYSPSKATAAALAVSLKLNLDQTLELLETAGYTLSRSRISDLIIEYFISSGIYDLFLINETLYTFNQQMLSASASSK
ncbi:MAG: hypothetical protein K9K80_01845 [Spirochaetia bacterium]|nr:hypothetical protein [Spirochaetia bacterium]